MENGDGQRVPDWLGRVEMEDRGGLDLQEAYSDIVSENEIGVREFT